MSWRTLAALATLLGCSVPNQDHCAVNDGDASCRQRGDDRQYCSKCVGENNGCVFEPVGDPVCAAGTGGPTTASSTAPGSTGLQPTDSGGPTSTTLPTETTGPTTGMTSTTTTTTGMTTTTTGPDTTGTSEPGTTGTTGTTGSGTTTTTGPDTTTTTMGGSDTEPGGKCGNGFLEGQENCDGINFGGETCQSLNAMYGGGTLSCTDMCQISYENCCYKAGVQCANNSECCPGLTCKLGLPAKCG
jgi:hypothetical protein